MKRQFKKYEFNTKSTAQKYIKELWVEDAEGNKSRKTYQVEVEGIDGVEVVETKIVEVSSDEGTLYPLGGVRIVVRVLYSFTRGTA
jgi:hypothetical protein